MNSHLKESITAFLHEYVVDTKHKEALSTLKMIFFSLLRGDTDEKVVDIPQKTLNALVDGVYQPSDSSLHNAKHEYAKYILPDIGGGVSIPITKE